MDIYIMRDGEETGPFSETATQQLLAQGDAAGTDLAWRPGMPQWIPLQSLLQPEPDSPAEQPEPEPEPADEVIDLEPSFEPAQADPLPAALVPESPAAAAPSESPIPPPALSGEPATPKQKAFLSYLGIAFPAAATREQAALLVNDAMENPKDATRLTRWNEDRLRLHPELFAAELQAKKEGRAQHYFELTQSEGAECFEGVTKAHCQVLVGFLDITHPSWDGNEREAAWNYFFPAIAEKFPQVVRKEWRGKLHYPQGPKVAREMKRGAPPMGAPRVTKKRPSPVAALAKGLVYGAFVLGIGAGGYFLWQHPEHVIAARKQIEKYFGSSKAVTKANRAVEEKKPTDASTTAPAPASAGTSDSLFGPAATAPSSTASSDQAPMAAASSAPGETMNAAPETTAASGSMAAAPTGDAPLFDPGTASTAPAMNDAGSLFAPSTPAATPAVAPKTKVTLTKAIDVQTAYGQVSVPAGTVLKIVAHEGDSLRVNYANSVIPVPVASTDFSDAATPPAPAQ